MVPPRKANRRRPSGGELVEVPVEVAHDGADGHARVLLGRGPSAASHRVVSLTSRGTKPVQSPGVPHGVEQDPGLVTRARAELDEGVRLGALRRCPRRGSSRSARSAPGRVVLGEPGDLVEEPAAPVVVEPHRREALGRAVRPGADVVLQWRPAGRRPVRWMSMVGGMTGLGSVTALPVVG